MLRNFSRVNLIRSRGWSTINLRPYSLNVRNAESFTGIDSDERSFTRTEESDVVVEQQSDMIGDEPMSPFRREDGSYIKGNNASEARLHDWTLIGRSDRAITKLPKEVGNVISRHILSQHEPDKLRAKAAVIFQSLNKDQIQKAPEDELDCDGHIAALFLQDYTNCLSVLKDLQKRVGDSFNPQRVLDIGYGPATGMVALNEMMGDEWVPKEKDVYIIGRSLNGMEARAKVILSRQLNENLLEEEEIEEEQVEDKKEATPIEQSVPKEMEEEFVEEEFEEEEFEEVEEEEGFSMGSIDTSKIQIKTKFRDALPVDKQYDLIIVNQCLLKREYNFPRDVDMNLHPILRLLSPGGHVVFVERGNAVGFETIARARQVMIRPEKFDREHGKIPRPYVKGSSIKPQKMKSLDSIITDEDIEFEKHLLAKYGEADEEDLKFEFEDSEDFEVLPLEQPKSTETEVEGETTSTGLSSESVDYHLSIIAPCSHHSRCPLQLGNPSFYKIPKYKNRLSFCSFHKTVERPKYTMELKRGKRLATKWDKSSHDGFGLDKLSKSTLQTLEGSGRPGGNDYESGSYSYLIAERALNDVENIKKIEEQRKFQSEELDMSNANNWPRIMKQPLKLKQNVKIEVCSPSGKIEVWDVPKSVGKQEYHDARKAERGDLWALGKKTVTVRNSMSEEKIDNMKVESKKSKKKFLKEERKKKWKKIVSSSEEKFDEDFMQLADRLATDLESSQRYKQKGKKAGFSVDPTDHDGL
ncbi:probable S-adenosyl-L-methionine-dependent RNA methyltransferase Rsm22p, mitochondrial [[Candida] anglica]|uniref:Probable S-adenosyl-L-methionine-dependent RNA methyltransferase Rsm22p, mitochondrial n=1 Tax=[Candida] anglica TaxID=148631 RepID=A0ABP0EGE8_9ASCO